MKHHYFSALLVLSLAILPITFLSCNSSSGGGGVDGKIRYEAEILAGTIGYSIHIDYVDNDGNNKYTTKEIYEPDDSPQVVFIHSVQMTELIYTLKPGRADRHEVGDMATIPL